MAAELADSDPAVMPPQNVLVGYCQTLVRQHEVAAALEIEPVGTTTWRRLITTESDLAKRIATFCGTYFADPVPAVDVDGVDFDDEWSNPFATAVADGGTPSQIKTLPRGPMPHRFYENPIPPADPQYRDVWERSMARCAANHPEDPVYAPFRFRRGDVGQAR